MKEGREGGGEERITWEPAGMPKDQVWMYSKPPNSAELHSFAIGQQLLVGVSVYFGTAAMCHVLL